MSTPPKWLDKAAVDAAYQDLLAGVHGAADQLWIAAWPMAGMVVQEFLKNNPAARASGKAPKGKHRDRSRLDDMIGAATVAIGEAIRSLEKKVAAGNAQPIKHGIRTYLNTCATNAVSKHNIENQLLGPSAATVLRDKRLGIERTIPAVVSLDLAV